MHTGGGGTEFGWDEEDGKGREEAGAVGPLDLPVLRCGMRGGGRGKEG